MLFIEHVISESPKI